MKIFLDESGNPNLRVFKSESNYNVFVLGAICFTEKNYLLFDKEFKKIKTELFGDEKYLIHNLEINRPNRFLNEATLKFSDENFRKVFYSKMEKIFDDFDFEIFAFALDKNKYKKNCIVKIEDPYLFAFEAIIDNIISNHKNSFLEIYPEKRSTIEDNLLKENLDIMKKVGTKKFSAKYINSKIKKFKLLDKKSNDSGLQLADLIVNPIGRQILGFKPKIIGNEIRYETIEKRLKSGELIVFP